VSAQPSLLEPAIPAPPRAGSYACIYADPPWLERGAGQIRRGADHHYELMKTKDIAALPVPSWAAPNAHLYCWVTNNFLEDGLFVMKAWDFRYVTKIDWFKGDIDDTAPVEQMDDAALQMGIGQYFRGVTESCLFGVRGSLPYRFLEGGKRAQGRTGFHAPRLAHSVKPEKFRAMVERVSAGPYLELFARRPVDGWDVWGNEAAA
jgi:N6-adenosine-specific RNA methylase IME4